MSVLCPSCGAHLETGALRCRHCGADAREAARPRGVGATFSLSSILAPDQERKLDLLAELEQLAPDVLLWLKSHPKERERLIEIVLELYGDKVKR